MREEEARRERERRERNRRALDSLTERGIPIAPGMRVLPPGTPSYQDDALRRGLPLDGMVDTPEGPVFVARGQRPADFARDLVRAMEQLEPRHLRDAWRGLRALADGIAEGSEPVREATEALADAVRGAFQRLRRNFERYRFLLRVLNLEDAAEVLLNTAHTLSVMAIGVV